MDQYTESVLIFLGINIVLALSLSLPVSAGLLSLGQGGFMAIGAYASAVLTKWYGVPFPLALITGGLLASLAGVAVGFPALRIKGVYLLILTLGFGEIVRIFFLNFEPTGAASGLGGIRQATTPLGVALSVAYLASSYRDAFAFAMMIAILLSRPQGLFGSAASVEARV